MFAQQSQRMAQSLCTMHQLSPMELRQLENRAMQSGEVSCSFAKLLVTALCGTCECRRRTVVGRQRITVFCCYKIADSPSLPVRARLSARRDAWAVQCGWQILGAFCPCVASAIPQIGLPVDMRGTRLHSRVGNACCRIWHDTFAVAMSRIRKPRWYAKDIIEILKQLGLQTFLGAANAPIEGS